MKIQQVFLNVCFHIWSNSTRTLQSATLCLVAILGSQMAQAGVIVTAPGDDSLLESILAFDAGPLGIVDIDFGGNDFNLAFGTDPVPPGFLFPSSRSEALAIISNISAELNLYNASAPTDITRVKNAIPGTSVSTAGYINVAYDVTASTIGLWQINSGWSAPIRGTEYGRTTQNFVYARMTASSVAVPEPTSLAVFGIGALGMVGTGIRRRRKQA